MEFSTLEVGIVKINGQDKYGSRMKVYVSLRWRDVQRRPWNLELGAIFTYDVCRKNTITVEWERVPIKKGKVKAMVFNNLPIQNSESFFFCFVVQHRHAFQNSYIRAIEVWKNFSWSWQLTFKGRTLFVTKQNPKKIVSVFTINFDFQWLLFDSSYV